MRPRTLRAANRHLYLGFALIVAGAETYTLCTQEAEPWRHILTITAAIACLIWGIHYATTKYAIDATAATYSTFGATRCKIAWSDLTCIEVHRTETEETAACTILLTAGDKTMQISSDLLPLDAVQELASDLRSAGILPETEEKN